MKVDRKSVIEQTLNLNEEQIRSALAMLIDSRYAEKHKENKEYEVIADETKQELCLEWLEIYNKNKGME